MFESVSAVNENKKLGNQSLETLMTQKERLTADKFALVDLELSVEEHAALAEMQIKEVGGLDSYGVDSQLVSKLKTFLEQVGENSPEASNKVASLINRLCDQVKVAFGQEAVWLTVRVSVPTNKYDLPRWHQDGRYFTATEPVYKFVAPLIGPQTLLGKCDDLEKFRALSKQLIDDDGEYDLEIQKALINEVTEMTIAQPSQGTVFLVDDEEAVIHSEPKMNVPRLFISILPGTTDQIEEWKKQCEEE
mgnify:CR=1 FL=1